MTFELEVSGFGLEIGIANLENLKLHEDIIDSLLNELASSIEADGEMKDPIIADKKTGVVLDGMHRVVAIESLGYDKIPTCYVDYQDSGIKVGSWCRVFQDLQMKDVLDICEALGFEIGECEKENVEKILDERTSEFLFVSKDECQSLKRDSASLKEVYDDAVSVEKALKKEGYEPRYEAGEGIPQNLDSNEIVLLLPSARKKEVINIALSDSSFPHKTTRHVIPARPMRIDVPLDLLEKSVQEADRQLSDLLDEREFEHLPAGSSVGGRKYEEELLLFE